MAWRNCQQAITATIPQLMLTDENADAFMQALIAAGNNTSAKTAAYNTYIKPLLTNTYCQTNDLVSEKIAGDTTNYINCTVEGGFATFYFYYNNTQQVQPLLSQSRINNWVCGYVACVDDENQVGFWQGFTIFITNPLNVGNFGGSQPAYSGESANNVYTILTGNEYHQYNWKSVSAINGKLGNLSLTMIKDADIGDGSRVLAAPYSVLQDVVPASSLYTMMNGLTEGQTVDYIYSGDNFKMTISRGGTLGNQITFAFFLNQTTPGTWSAFYSYTTTAIHSNRINNYLGFIIDDENEVAALNIIETNRNQQTDVITVNYCVPGTTMTAEDMHLLWGWLKGSFLKNPDVFVDNDGDGGGDLVNRINNPIPTPGLPHASAYDTGFISQYMISKTQLNALARFLWSAGFVDNVKKFFEDPMQIIMGLTIMPVVPTVGDARTIKAGNISTGVTGSPLVNQFERHPMGKVTIEKRLKSEDKLGGVYFDYAPYTDIKIYLPYCGEHSLDTNDVIGKTLQLDYTLDYITGVCVAHLTILDPDDADAPGECHYNFAGQMGVQVPVSQADYSGIYRGLLSAGITLGTAAATIATGGLTAPMAGAAAYNVAGVNPGPNARVAGSGVALGMGSASRLANNVSNMQPVVEHTSGGGAVSGHVGCEYPYITISEPDVFQAENQPHYKGYPINATHDLGDMDGFVQIENIHLDGLSCTERERESISSYLKGGVIINKTDPSSTPDHSAPSGELAVVFLKNVSDPETIGKHWTDSSKVTGKLLYNNDIENIKLLVHGNYTAYNYCYIHELGRYYYINTFIIEKDGDFTVDMTVDALQSFKDELLNIPALIDSAEGPAEYVRMMMNNGYWYMKQKKNIITQMFKDDGGHPTCFDKSENGDERYIITIAGDCEDEPSNNEPSNNE